MSDHEFDDLSTLWKQELSPEEERIFQSLARKVSLRAKLIQHIELGLSLLLVIGLFAAFFYDPRPAATALIILVIAAMGWSAWKRREVHQVAAIIDSSDRQSLLSSAIKIAEARLRQSNWSLIGVPPGLFLGMALRGTVGRDFTVFIRTLGEVLAHPITIAGIIGVFLMWLYIARQNLRLRHEIKRLRELQDQYLRETRLDGDR